MAARAKLLDKAALDRRIEALGLDDNQKACLKDRWLTYIVWWDTRSAHARWWYFALRSAIVVAGALVVAFVSLRELAGDSGWGVTFALLSIVASLVVSICAGIETLWSFAEVWREKRTAGEMMKSEGYRYFGRTGAYGDRTHAEAWPDFATQVEDIIASEVGDYFAARKPQKDRDPQEDATKEPDER